MFAYSFIGQIYAGKRLKTTLCINLSSFAGFTAFLRDKKRFSVLRKLPENSTKKPEKNPAKNSTKNEKGSKYGLYSPYAPFKDYFSGSFSGQF
jgi:hypothetical protein